MSQRMALALVAASLASLAFLSRTRAQEALERERVFCDPGAPWNHCPGPDCVCLDDTLEVTFDGATQSIFEYESFEEGAAVDTVIVAETRTQGVSGWSFAVEHDDSFLTLLDVTLDGTDAKRAKAGGFAVADRIDIEACPHGDPSCRNPVPKAGYISAVILGFTETEALPLQRNSICIAKYALQADPGPNGTLLQLVHHRLRKRGSPPVDINFTTGSKSREPKKLIDGWVKAAGQAVLEICGNGVDDDGDGKADCDDRECIDWPACRPEICDNSRDDDADGLVDCQDPDCFDRDRCGPRPEVCDNGRDDDRDGAIDCSDSDCDEDLSCPPKPEICGNFQDEDRDGLIDCDDPDCAASEDCFHEPERKRVFCDKSDPRNGCPGIRCFCVEDTLEVTFDGQGDSIFQYDDFHRGAPIATTIVMDTRSTAVQGWQFAVEHDASFLTLLDVTVKGTDAERVFGFLLVDRVQIEACLPDDSGCKNPVPGSGYISAVIVSLTLPAELPLQRNSLCRAKYALQADPGATGTLIQIVDRRLKKRGSPPVDVNITVDGTTRAPKWVVDGWVKATEGSPGGPGGNPQAPFLRGDADGNSRINVVDPIVLVGVLFGNARPKFDCDALLDVTADGRIDVIDSLYLLRFIFSRGPDVPAPFPGCGRDPTTEPGLLACVESNCG